MAQDLVNHPYITKLPPTPLNERVLESLIVGENIDVLGRWRSGRRPGRSAHPPHTHTVSYASTWLFLGWILYNKP